MMRHAIVLLVLAAGSASAEPPARVFAGSIVASAKAFAPTAKTDAETVAAIRKQAASTFAEDKKEHTWTVFLAGYFKQPVDDMEYLLVVRDLSNKSQVVLSTEKYLSARGARSATTKLVLDRDKVGVNKQLLVTMEIKNKAIATTRIVIAGEGEQHTGKVDFSDGDDDDDAAAPPSSKK